MADDLTKMMTEQLRDAYSAEKQALRAMPKMMKKASAQALKDAIQKHIDQTEGQIERLDRALEAVGGKPGRKICEGMRGIIEEGQSELEDHDKGPMLDALIVAGSSLVVNSGVRLVERARRRSIPLIIIDREFRASHDRIIAALARAEGVGRD